MIPVVNSYNILYFFYDGYTDHSCKINLIINWTHVQLINSLIVFIKVPPMVVNISSHFFLFLYASTIPKHKCVAIDTKICNF